MLAEERMHKAAQHGGLIYKLQAVCPEWVMAVAVLGTAAVAQARLTAVLWQA